MENPFRVHTPEQLSAEDIARNFVELYTDFPKLKEPVNMFIHGARGTGKSMMLRSLEPSVQALLENKRETELPFFAVRVPIKQTVFGNPELRRLEGWTAASVGEHLLSVYVLMWICEALKESPSGDDAKSRFERLKEVLAEMYEDCGGKESVHSLRAANTFGDISNFCEKELRRVKQYYIRIPALSGSDIYGGALTSFADVLLPFVRALRDLNFIGERPICGMIDDADNLPEQIQRVLNTWISMRSARYICFKVTTQLGYATYRTIDDRIIESPHDFSEVNVGTVYTSNKDAFSQRIKAIVEKRLSIAGLSVRAEEFFPPDVKQEARLEEIRRLIATGKTEGLFSLRGAGATRERDNVQRFAIPALMRELAGSNRSSHTYSYAGLRSLTDLSSGVVRWFLEPASRMFHEVASMNDRTPECIPAGVQDDVIATWSKEFHEALSRDPGAASSVEVDGASLHSMGHSPKEYGRLKNLLDGLGEVFRQRVLDASASEQRVFSFVLVDDPDEELASVLQLGLRLGYFQRSDTASKNTLGGRRPRYIMSRRLGPYYKLDVSGHAAHLSVKCSALHRALDQPRAFVRSRLGKESQDSGQTELDLGNHQ